MKLVLTFILFLIVGFLIPTGYAYWNQQQSSFAIPNQAITTKFSLANAPDDSLKGNIASMSGTVTWLSRVATKPVQLTAPRSIQQGEELGTGKNGKVIVTIQNAAAVSLSPNSDVNFIQMLPVNIVIAQDKGSVIYQNIGPNAMTVNILDMVTTVNRSLAEISVDQAMNTVTVIVEKGSVTVGYEDLQNNSNVVTVNAGSQFVFDDTTRVGTVL